MFSKGDALENQETLKRLMGENKEEQQRKLRERLERKKKRLAQGSFSTLYYFKIISKALNHHCHFKKIITVQTTHDRKPYMYLTV